MNYLPSESVVLFGQIDVPVQVDRICLKEREANFRSNMSSEEQNSERSARMLLLKYRAADNADCRFRRFELEAVVRDPNDVACSNMVQSRS
eukprot:5272473-Pleurochrysis_carterae.AAC.1